MLGTNYFSIVLPLISIWLASSLSIAPAVQTSDVRTSDVQTSDPRSGEAAKLLDKAVVQFEKLPVELTRSKSDIRARLLLTLVKNRQYDEAESVLDGTDDWPAKQLLAAIGKARVASLAEAVGTTGLTADEKSQKIEAINRLSKKSGVHPVSNLSKSIDKLLKHDRVELATNIIDNSHGDMDNYQIVPGSHGNSRYKMLGLAKIAEYQLRKGNVKAADKIFARFGKEITRDHARLSILENCIRKGQRDDAIAESMHEELEGKDQKFWGSLRLTNHFVSMQNLEKSIQYADAMEETFSKSKTGLHQYHARLLLNIAHLELDKGKNADRWIERAEELAGKNEFVQLDLICIKAFDGNLDAVNKSPAVAMKLLESMLNFRRGNPNSHTPMRLVADERIISCAIEIAESFADPYFRANALCAIAAKVAKTDKDKAKQIVLSALEAAKENDSPTADHQSPEIDQPHALQQVANRFAQIGEFKQAIKTIELIPDEPDPEFKTADVIYTKREIALGQMSRILNQPGSAFVLQDSHEALAIVSEIQKYAPQKAEAMLNALTGKFVDLGNWSAAEKLYKQGKEQLRKKGKQYEYTHGLPYQIVPNIAASQDYEKLRLWFDLCDDKYKSGFVQTFCNHLNVRNIVPNSRTTIEVESMLKEIAQDESPASLPVQKFLIVGFWADGLEDRAKKLIAQLKPRKMPFQLKRGHRSMLREFAIQADKSDLPELAILLARTVDDPPEIATYLFSGTFLVRSFDRSNKLIQDKQKFEALEPEFQILLLIRHANFLMLTPQ